MATNSEANLNLIFGRRSIRVYAPGEVCEAKITLLLECAMAAPSAMGKDPWRFVTVRERASLDRMAAALPGGKMLTTAAAAIVICGDLEVALDRQLSFLLQDCSACVENLLLGAHGLGLGACWVGVHPSEESIRAMKAQFALPASVIPIAVVALGQPGEQPGPRTRYNVAYVHHERW